MPNFSADNLLDLVTRIFAARGVPAPIAAVVADSLVLANLKGHDSHGVWRVAEYLDQLDKGWINPTGSLVVLHEGPARMHVSGQFGFGQFVGREATQRAIAKAQQDGVCVLSACECGHLGRMGEFAEMAAAAGLVFFSWTNTHGGGLDVAPHGGRAKYLSSNPLAAGAPAPGGEPIIMDFSTGAIAAGKIHVARTKQERLPPGCIVNNRGEPSTDPNDYYADPPGALLPFGEHKGFALSVFCDILAGALSGAGTSKLGVKRIANATLMLVVDPGAFAGAEFFAAEITAYAAHLKSCPRRQGVEEILLPGEPEARAFAQRQRTGITLPEVTWQTLRDAADRLGVEVR